MGKNEKIERLIERLWMFQITIEDNLKYWTYPNFQIRVATKQEMKKFIQNCFKKSNRVKINKCKEMTNADWLYLNEYEKWWNDQNLITPDCLKHH